MQLATSLAGATQDRVSNSPAQPVGLVLDLTDQHQDSLEHAEGSMSVPTQLEAYPYAELPLDWYVAALLESIRFVSALPLLVVSYEGSVEAALQRLGARFVMQVDPQADDSVWHYVITRILSASYDTYDSLGAAAGHKQVPLALPPAELRLSHNVWIDLLRCVLVSPPDMIALTGREMRVLRVLTQHLGRFFTATELARQVGDSSADLIDGHCIEQTISGLRRKFGETAEAQHILVSRRGLGYALMPDVQEGTLLCKEVPRRTSKPT